MSSASYVPAKNGTNFFSHCSMHHHHWCAREGAEKKKKKKKKDFKKN
jgi:hypothetical protein